MLVAQRATSDSSTNGIGTVDRFGVIRSGVDEDPTQAQVDVASGTTPYSLGFRKAFKVTNGNQSGGTGVVDYISMRYKFEAQDIANSGWNYTSSSSFVTLSFWCKSSVAQNFYGYFYSHDGTAQAYAFETGSLTADTWKKVVLKIPGNSNLQFDNNNDIGLDIYISQFWGTDRTDGGKTLNAWASYNGAARTPDFTSTWYTTDNATWEMTGVQFEVGSEATPFEHRSFGEELQLCKRYFNMYSRTHADSGDEAIIANGFYWSSSRFMAPLRFDVPMRTNSWSLYKVTGSNYFRIYNNGVGSHQVNDVGLNGQAHVSSAHLNIDSGLSSSGAAGVFFMQDSAARIGFDAEL